MSNAATPTTMNISVKYAKPRLIVLSSDGDSVSPKPVNTTAPRDAGLKKSPNCAVM